MKKITILPVLILWLLPTLSFVAAQIGEEVEEVKDIDNNTYQTIIIGTQEWMVENLKTTRFNNGDTVPYAPEDYEWSGRSTPAYSWYDNNESFKDVYGALYNSYAAETGNLCPVGWHVSTREDWDILEEYLGGAEIAGGKLKEEGTDHWGSPNEGATNESGFTALPGGYRSPGYMSGGYVGFWHALDLESEHDGVRRIDWNRVLVDAFSSTRGSNGYSVRCVRNEEAPDLGAEFHPDVTMGEAPLAVQFTDESFGNVEMWAWDFGDGNDSFEQHPIHTYMEPGTYTVGLYISDGMSVDSLILEDLITVTDSGTVNFSTLRGQVTSALDGQPIEGAQVEVAGLVTFTDIDGYYVLEEVPEASTQITFQADVTSGFAPLETQFTSTLREGYHTITVTSGGYSDFVFNGLIVEGEETVFDLSLSPDLVDADLRFVLNWAEYPQDLDSHMGTPSGYHVWFQDYGYSGEEPFVTLDHDITSGFGPETITIYSRSEGTYHYYVHNYSGEYSGDAPLTSSQAVVQIYDANGLLNTIEVPQEGDGLYWYVATIDGVTGRIDVVNRIQSEVPVSEHEQELHKTAPVSKPGASNFAMLTEENPSTGWEYYWDFGDDSYSMEENPVHTYETPGIYTVSLMAVSEFTEVYSERRDYIEVLESSTEPSLEADFTVDITEGPAPLEVQFTDRSTGDIESWVWDFGDGNISEDQHPIHTYVEPGVYTVSLLVSNENEEQIMAVEDMIVVNEPHIGEYSTLQGHVTSALDGLPVEGAEVTVAGLTTLTDENGYYILEEVPEATTQITFQADITSGFAPLETQFSSTLREGYHTITVTAEGYSDFVFNGLIVEGDETLFDLSLSPELAEGSGLRFVLNWGDTPRDLDSHMRTPSGYHVWYQDHGRAEEDPFVTLDYDITTGYGPETITVYSMIEGTYHYYIYNYSGEAPIAGSQAVVQIYDNEGLLNTVEAPEIGEGLYWHVATIDGLTGRVNIVDQIHDEAPVPDEEMMKTAPKAAYVSISEDTPPEGWVYHWDFGDDMNSDEENPQHIYEAPGLYTVTLTASNDVMQISSTRRNYIEVLDPASDIEAVNDTVYVMAGTIVRINPMENDLFPEDMEVFFEIGSVTANHGMIMPTADETGFIYASAVNFLGADIVEYYLIHPHGHTMGTVYIEVVEGEVVNQSPLVALPIEVSILEDESIVIPMKKLVFDDRDPLEELEIVVSSDNPDVFVEYRLSEANVVIRASEDWWGPAVITITATDTDGEVSSDNMIVTFVPVNDPPESMFEIENQEMTKEGIAVHFKDLSHDDRDPEGAVVAWRWDFGDGNTSTDQNPVHVYSEIGEYKINLTVSDNAGAEASMEMDHLIEITSIEEIIIHSFQLHGNYPNPFNPTTMIQFDIPEDGLVTIDVFNSMGQRVSRLKNEIMSAGQYKLSLDAAGWSSGLYLYTVRYNGKMYTGKMTLIK